jgi:D-glycero-D-manno-heptose 1,7-bisphosphate phosphatase
MNKAVFLDRDGTIIEDVGHIDSYDKIRFMPRVSEAISLLNKNGFKVVVVSNQAGVAKGLYTEDTVKEINFMIQHVLAKCGAKIDEFYYCPHHKDGIVEKYKKDCYCRKPRTGMLRQAAKDLKIKLNKSFMIGDKACDIEAGHKAGCKTIMLATKNPKNKEEISISPNHISVDLYGAAKLIEYYEGLKK